MNIREQLRVALLRPGQGIVLDRPVVEEILRQLGPEPDIEGHQFAPFCGTVMRKLAGEDVEPWNQTPVPDDGA